MKNKIRNVAFKSAKVAGKLMGPACLPIAVIATVYVTGLVVSACLA